MRSSEARKSVNPGGERPPRSLEELGVPAQLARELEGALRALGEVEGGRAIRRSFVTPDGASHALRVDDAPSGA
jgi:hypothetical protein